MALSKSINFLINRAFRADLRRTFHYLNRPMIFASPYVLKQYCTQKPKQERFTPISDVIHKGMGVKSYEDTEDEKAKMNAIRSIKYSFTFLGITLICVGTYLIIEFGKPVIDSDGTLATDEFSDMPILKQYIYRCVKQLVDFAVIIKQPSRDKLLPDEVQYPYYQPPYTLVLEFTDVMVHPDWTYKTGWRFKKRPGLDYFLESLAGLYEIVVYTAEQGITVFPIIENLDPKNLITYKLVRDATHFVDGHHVKDLDKLNRDLKKVIVVDWNPESVKLHPDNLFHIPRWTGNDNDQTLVDLVAFLKTVATNEVEDVREVLRYYSQFEDPLVVFKEKQRAYIEMQEQKSKEKPRHSFSLFRW